MNRRSIMRTAVALLWLPLLMCAASRANDAQEVRRDVPYSDAGGRRTNLDVYPAGGKGHPVVVWIHGGAWQLGDKSQVQLKPKAFGAQGYLLVSVNYRLHPAVTYKEQAGDIARAIRWVHDHAEEHGGDPKRIFLLGHSAGAHLAALVGIDGRYLEQARLNPADLAGVILLDGAGYDIPRQIRDAVLPRLRTIYTNIFSDDEAAQREASPITHVASGKGIPPFLILHVARRRDSKVQSESLAAKLKSAGVEAAVLPAVGKTHMTINRELGEPDDAPTRAVFAFLKTRCQNAP